MIFRLIYCCILHRRLFCCFCFINYNEKGSYILEYNTPTSLNINQVFEGTYRVHLQG
jgi:hypothetical protein